MNRRLLIAASILALAVLPNLLLKAEDPAPVESLKGKPAPDIALKTLDGGDFKLSDHKGSVVVLDFWATWCPPCREGLPHIQSLHADKKRAEQGLKVFAINHQEKPDAAEKFLKEQKFTFPVPMDVELAAAKSYSVRGIPTTVVIGRDGTVKAAFEGFSKGVSEKPLDEAVDAALKEAKPREPAAK